MKNSSEYEECREINTSEVGCNCKCILKQYVRYRYDTETGLYYLNSRYYNPEWGRYINADGITGITGALLSHNMFAYCMNNPVNMEDPSGYLSVGIALKNSLGVAADICTIATGIGLMGTPVGWVIGGLFVAHAVFNMAGIANEKLNLEKRGFEAAFGKKLGNDLYNSLDIAINFASIGASLVDIGNGAVKVASTYEFVRVGTKYPAVKVVSTTVSKTKVAVQTGSNALGIYSMVADGNSFSSYGTSGVDYKVSGGGRMLID